MQHKPKSKKRERKVLATFRFRPAFREAVRLEAKAERISQDELLEKSFYLYHQDVRKLKAEERTKLERQARDYIKATQPATPSSAPTKATLRKLKRSQGEQLSERPSPHPSASE